MKNLRPISFLLLSTAFVGCIPQSFELRVKHLESSVNDIRSLQAEQTSQIADLQSELRKLTGKTEEIEYTTNQKFGTDMNSLKQDLSSLKRRVPPPANVPVQPLEEDEVMAERGGFTYLSDALLKLRAGNYTDALPQLEQALSTVPSDYQANVIFWQGVTYDGLSEFKNALATYNDLITSNPKSRRAPLALIRQASVFERIGDGKAAQFALQKLISDYPDAPEAISMKSKLPPPPTPAPSNSASAAKKKKK